MFPNTLYFFFVFVFGFSFEPDFQYENWTREQIVKWIGKYLLVNITICSDLERPVFIALMKRLFDLQVVFFFYYYLKKN